MSMRNEALEKYAFALHSSKDLYHVGDDMDCTWEEAMNNDAYYEPHTYDTKGQTFVWIWTSYIDKRILRDPTLTTDEVIFATNLFQHPPRIAFNFLINKHVDWYRDVNLHDSSQWDKRVWLDKMMCLTRSFQECRRFYVLSLHATNRKVFYSAIIDAMCRYAIDIELNISDNDVDWQTVYKLIHAREPEVLMRCYKSLILSDPRYVLEVVKTKKYTCDEFYEVVPEITILMILKRPKTEITKELYNGWFSVVGVDPPAILYLHTYLEAPPKWMCTSGIKDELKRACISENIVPPTYLDPDYCVDVKHCEHSADEYYADDLESEVVCDKCMSESSDKTFTRVFNIRCPICFEDVPEKVHIFDCNHTVCKECYGQFKKCPFCNRN